jgi:hypothetical protein
MEAVNQKRMIRPFRNRRPDACPQGNRKSFQHFLEHAEDWMVKARVVTLFESMTQLQEN